VGGELDRFVGRRAELRRLQGLRDQVAAGTGQVALVSGPAGIGKTRLCEEDAALARRSGFTVVWGRCWPGGGAPALWPWHDVLAELRGPGVAALLEDDRGGSVDPDRFTRFVAVVEELARHDGPVYLVLDDLHAAEPAAVLLTRFVARARHRLPMLVVVTVNESADGDGPRRALDQLGPEGTRIRLGPLEPADTAELLAERAGDVDPALVATVHRLTGGNPLHVQRAAASGDPRRAAGLTAGLRGVVEDWVRSVKADVLAVLSVAAVLGPVPSVAETAEVAGVEPRGVLAAVAAAAAARLVGRADTDSFEFSHGLVREALIGTLSAGERLDVHARAAAALRDPRRRASRERLARRAHHATMAAARSPEDAAEAVTACRAAAASMIARFDYEQAADLLAAAVRLHERGLGAPPATLLVERARAVLSSGRLAEARELFERAIEAATAEDDPVLRADAALGLGGVWVHEHREVAERERVLAVQRAALAGLGPAHEVLRLRLQVRLTAESVYLGDPVDGALELLAEARRLGDARALAEALSLTHHVLLRPDHTHERLELADELVEVASAAGDGVLVLMGLCWRVVDLFQLGDPQAHRALADLRVRADAVNSRNVLYIVHVIDVMLALREGRLEAAEAAAADCHRLGVEVGDVDAFGYYAAQLLAVRWLQGRGAELLELAAEAADSPTLVPAEFAFQATVARLAADAGQLERARAGLDRLSAAGLDALPQSSTWLTGMLAIAEAAAALSDVAVAKDVYRLLLPFAELPVMPSLGVACFGSTHRPLGLAALTAGDVAGAVHHLDQAVVANVRLGNRPMTACCRADLALALLRRDQAGDRRRAELLLDQAIEVAEQCGMPVRAAAWLATRRDVAAHAGATPIAIRREHGRWRLAHRGGEVVVDDLVGMRYLARLLAEPGRQIPALELAGSPAGPVEPSRQPVIDQRARAEYAARARVLSDAVRRARADGDAGQVQALEDEIEALTRELGRSTDRHGRARSFAGPAERARTAVRKAISRALDAVEAGDPTLGQTLRGSVTTGYECSYTPQARASA
jgi:tetratricopeptide (TPR) repeat protein